MAKVDWNQLKQLYISDQSTSYADLAEQYQISIQAVKHHGAKEGWVELRHKQILNIDQSVALINQESIQLVNVRHALIGRQLQQHAVKSLLLLGEDKYMNAVYNLDDSLKVLKVGVNLERKALGLDKR